MNYRHFIFGILLIATAALLAPGCRKIEPMLPEVSEDPETPEDPEVPLVFNVVADSTMTKAVAVPNKPIGSAYDKNESFVAYAAYSENRFSTSSYSDFWDPKGITCSYSSTYNAWTPSAVYYWPRVGYLSFQAYSPAGAEEHMDSGTGPGSGHHFSWDTGFSFEGFTIRAAGSQYDLLYTDLVKDCQRANYTITHNDGYDGYDDDPNYPEFIYNGINLTFHHALSQIEVQTSSSLGSNASLKYYVQKIEIINAFDNGTFTQSTGAWDVNDSVPMVNYTVLNKDPDWQLVPGADETPVSVNPAQTLMLLPQTLDRGTVGTFETGTDAYLKVTYKEGASGTTRTAQIPLTDPWITGKKYIYKLVFSNYIEFTATITKWDDEIVGYHRIII